MRKKRRTDLPTRGEVKEKGGKVRCLSKLGKVQVLTDLEEKGVRVVSSSDARGKSVRARVVYSPMRQISHSARSILCSLPLSALLDKLG